MPPILSFIKAKTLLAYRKLFVAADILPFTGLV